MRNEAFLKTALACLPTPKETEVPAVRRLRLHRTGEGIAEETIERTPMKKGDRCCFDFGDHQVGRLTLKLGAVGSHPDAPAWIRIQFAEQAAELFERAEDYHGWISTGWIQQEQLHVDVLPCMLRLPRRYAFRYVQIEVLDVSSKYSLTVEDAVCTAVSSAEDSDLAPLGSGDPMLDRMDAVACRTLHNCMQRVFEDGPKRDRRLWLGICVCRPWRITRPTRTSTWSRAASISSRPCRWKTACCPPPSSWSRSRRRTTPACRTTPCSSRRRCWIITRPAATGKP